MNGLLLQFVRDLRDQFITELRHVMARPTWVADRGSDASAFNGLEKVLGMPSVWLMANFGPFGLANTFISVCFFWPIPILQYAWSGQYPNYSMFCLQKPKLQSVWFSKNPHFGLMGRASTQISISWIWSIPTFKAKMSSWSPEHFMIAYIYNLCTTIRLKKFNTH